MDSGQDPLLERNRGKPFPRQGYVIFSREAFSSKHPQGGGREEPSLREVPIIGKAFGFDFSNE